MTHPFTPGTSADTCYTVLPPDHGDNENPGREWACGRRRLHLAHAIPFDQPHAYNPGPTYDRDECTVVIVEDGNVSLCDRSSLAVVHEPIDADVVEPGPMFPAKLVDRALLPPGPLFPGPEVDGAPTWLGRLEDLPAAYEFRYTATQAWKNPLAVTRDGSQWVQMRRRLPAPGDRVYVERPDRDSVPISFAEVVEAVVGAMPERELIPGSDFAEPEHSVAVAVWRLLTEGTTGA